MRILLALSLTAAVLLAARAAESQTSAPAELRVVVNAQNPATAVERKFLEEAFLKKVTRWDGGEIIHPVDRDEGSPLRRRFSDQVLQRSVEAVKSYWQQRVFSGDNVPPPELDSDAAVVRYVAKYPGAVGYVSAASSVDGVKVIPVR
jgi:ABC-type phosphate transport system substrate-binding protein